MLFSASLQLDFAVDCPGAAYVVATCSRPLIDFGEDLQSVDRVRSRPSNKRKDSKNTATIA